MDIVNGVTTGIKLVDWLTHLATLDKGEKS